MATIARLIASRPARARQPGDARVGASPTSPRSALASPRTPDPVPSIRAHHRRLPRHRRSRRPRHVPRRRRSSGGSRAGAKWLAAPNERTVHTTPDPERRRDRAVHRLRRRVRRCRRLLDRFDPLFARNSEPRGVLIAAALMFLIGLIDDIREHLRAGEGVRARSSSGVVLVSYGVTMFFFRLPFMDVLVLSDEWIPLITVLWVLGISQAINLIDGLDGLATGIVAIGAFAFFLYSQHLSEQGLLTQPNIGPLVSIITVGICVGFLPFNFNPARIFMGDGGALLLGLLLAVSHERRRRTRRSRDAALPGADVLLPRAAVHPAVHPRRADHRHAVRRSCAAPGAGQGVATADKGHLHHRLMEMGHGQRRSVVILWAWTGAAERVRALPRHHRQRRRLHPDRRRDARPRAVHGAAPAGSASAAAPTDRRAHWVAAPNGRPTAHAVALTDNRDCMDVTPRRVVARGSRVADRLRGRRRVVVIPTWVTRSRRESVVIDRGSTSCRSRGEGVKNRLHIDLAPHTSDDRDAEIARLLETWRSPSTSASLPTSSGFAVAGTQGHEFCVLDSHEHRTTVTIDVTQWVWLRLLSPARASGRLCLRSQARHNGVGGTRTCPVGRREAASVKLLPRQPPARSARTTTSGAAWTSRSRRCVFLGSATPSTAWLDTRPIFMIVFVVLALVGNFARMWFDYGRKMDQHEADRAAATMRRTDEDRPSSTRRRRSRAPAAMPAGRPR